MKLNYKERKALSSEEQSQKEVLRAVENAKLQLQSDILATQSALEDKKQELEDIKSEYPLCAIDIINLEVEVESLEDGLRRLKCLKDELGL